MEGVDSEGVGAVACSRRARNRITFPVQWHPKSSIDFDAEAAALAEEESTDVPSEQDDIDELDEVLTPGPEREDQDFRMPFLCGPRNGARSGPKRLVKKDSLLVWCSHPTSVC